MGESGAHFEVILRRVREKLNKDLIQLWQPPYTVEGQTAGNFPEVKPCEVVIISVINSC